MTTLNRPKRSLDQVSEDHEQPPAKLSKLSASTSRSALGDISNAQAKKSLSAGLVEKSGIRTRSAVQNAKSLSVVPIAEDDESLSSPSNESIKPAPVLTTEEQIEQWKIQCANIMYTDYSDHIFKHLRSTENLSRPDQKYMDTVQGDLSFAMRAILLDWLVEVIEEYNLQPQTYFLSVAYIDRYLSGVAIERGRLQLIGLSCILIASKYWEIYPPTIDDFVHICDSTYKKNEILECEKSILLQLQYKLVAPTAWEFSRRLLACKVLETEETRTMTEYLMELSVQEVYYMQHPPSMIAASSALVSILTATPGLKARDAWTATHVHASGYTVDAVLECARLVHATHVRVARDVGKQIEQGNSGFKAVKEKYAASVHGRASQLPPHERIEL